MASTAADETLGQILALLQVDYWSKTEFWISVVVGVVGLLFSFAAFWQARKARAAAVEAGRIVKLQTIVIDLTEISQRLDRLQPMIAYTDARDLVAEVSRRLRRIAAPYHDDNEVGDTVTTLREALDAAKAALDSVRPTDPQKEEEAPMAVYNAIEGHLATINNIVADLLGLFERRSSNTGEQHGGR